MGQARLADRPSLTLERFYPVAPEKVWRAWTDPQSLRQEQDARCLKGE
jgi:uncharacterized protein YndB with AHSA1/START domain